ncbi:NUDIX domain-containing protein [Kitasatospora sp. NPDC058115]|uniref:NUDIX hydrolase n=1 Tax=Kitasatospora sp. NPDC058115 TaxID=3346347 RepID=UPI0036DF712F
MFEHETPETDPAPLTVVAAAVVEDGRLLVVSKRAAPDVYYLPGGKPDAGEGPLSALTRELAEELGAAPVGPRHLAEINAVAALEGVPMRMTVFEAGLDRAPAPAAELAALRWTDGLDPDLRLAPAVRDQLLPLLRERGLLPGPARA